MRLGTVLAFGVLLATLSGCAAAGNPMASITGTLTYRQRIALPQGALVRVQLLDVSRADAPAILMGEHSFVSEHQVPLPFMVEYDPGTILASHIYALQAEIRDPQGRLLFHNDTIFPAIVGGEAVNEVEMVLQMVSGE